MSPTDRIAYDSDGLPVVTRTAYSMTTLTGIPLGSTFLHLADFARFNPIDPALAAPVADFRAHATEQWKNFFAHLGGNNGRLNAVNPAAERTHLGVAISQTGTRTTERLQAAQLPVGQMMLEYQKTAVAAQQQLAQDVATIDAYNGAVKERNDRVSQVLANATGKEAGDDPESWCAWWVNLQGYAYNRPPELPRPIVQQDVLLAYPPQPVPVVSASYTSSHVSPGPFTVTPSSDMPSCFGAGTLVRTLAGAQPIESIRVGDRVLTQDIKTGALGYHPVTVIHHNPSSPTFLVKVGGDTNVSSPFHRFWVAGTGWIMARDLKGGETLRLLEGPVSVQAVESGPVQPVFNLDVAGDHDFFAGAAAALVHDNTLPEIRLEPFDAVTQLSALSAAR